MPWSHCGDEFILDDEVCPTCGHTKEAWTLELEKTRTLVVNRPKKKDKKPKGAAWLEVELLDAHGLPVADEPCASTFPDGRSREGRTDARGCLRLEQLAEGECRLTFPAREGTGWQAARGERTLELELLDADGRPIVDEPVHVRLPSGEVREAQLDGRGALRLEGLFTDTCEVSFPRRGGEWQRAAPRPPAQGAPRSLLEVALVDAAGRPVAGEPYRLRLDDGRTLTGALDGDGILRCYDLVGAAEVCFPERDGGEWVRVAADAPPIAATRG